MTHDLVHLGLPWWDKVVRTLVVYLGLLFLLRAANAQPRPKPDIRDIMEALGRIEQRLD